MSSGPTDPAPPAGPHPAWAWLVLFGAFLTLRGYHSFDGDQAYRLPILLHQNDFRLYAGDPFVRAFDAFNPHRGYLAVVDAASRPFGLAAGLAGLFALTCGVMAFGVARLAREAWADRRVGLIAVGLFLLAKAGNVGTNHLFESTLLDRLVGFALGWAAVAWSVRSARGDLARAAGAIGLATLVHPSVGLQVGLTLAAGWVAWAAWPRSGVTIGQAARAIGLLGLALVPGVGLMAGQGGALFEGLPADEFRALAVRVQGPQHMLPSLWRQPQWVAWGCYPVLAALALGRVGLKDPSDDGPGPRRGRARLAVLLVVNLLSLGAAYLAVEVVGDLRVTLFQPFRMATLARGLALVAVAGRVAALAGSADRMGRPRALVLAAGLAGDRALALATAFEVALTGADLAGLGRRGRAAVAAAVLLPGLAHLARHDTESGHVPILLAVGASAAIGALSRLGVRPAWNRRRSAFAAGAAWAVPVLAGVGGIVAGPEPGAWSVLVARCRFAEVPTDDLERLAVWCRDHTPTSARFIGPPGPKTFRLWSRRAVAFNRAGSPYHARGLADWAGRYRDHVGFAGPTADFVRAYLADRHALEARYRDRSDAELAALADRQGASHVLVEGRRADDPAGRLEPLRREGRYAVYRVRPATDQGFAGTIRTDPIPAPRTEAIASWTTLKD